MPTVRQNTENAEFTFMQDGMKSTFLLYFGKRLLYSHGLHRAAHG